MTGKKDFKALEKRLERLGFTYDHQNASSQFVYIHERHPDLPVSPGINDAAAKHLLRKVEKTLNCTAPSPKRNAQAIKDRQASDRERRQADLTRLDEERRTILRRRDGLLDGVAGHLSNAEIRALETRVEEIDQERREIERLMNAPTSNRERGHQRARHEGGRR